MRRTIFLILILSLATVAGRSQNLPEAKWKFITGDDKLYASPAFNDSAWKDISPTMAWEQQGFPDYDGFAWYRVTVTIPGSMKSDAMKYGGLVLYLGKIDDVDFTYFNGVLIGSTGKLPPDYEGKWDTRREYRIAPDNIKFGKPNTIAVRVYDASGNGGIYSGPLRISSIGAAESIVVAPSFPQQDMIIRGVPYAEIPITLKNGFSKKMQGDLTVTVTSDFGENIGVIEEPIVIEKYLTGNFSFRLSGINPGFYSVTALLKTKSAEKEVKFSFGYEPEKIISPTDRQPDFQIFWSKAKEELASVDPQYNMIRIDSLCTPTHNIFLVEMHSLGNALIRGWYRVPVKPGRYPAVMHVPGYSSTIQPSYINYGDEIIGFGLNIRGHGNSKDDVNPGFPGYILNNIEDKEKYIYRGAYMDCIRGIDFLFSRPEVDTTRVAVEGASQGGALTFATAALDNERVRVCAPQVPFLSDFRDYFKVAQWPGNEFINYVEIEKRMTWEEVYRVLSYFDIKNLAPMIKAPLMMGVGLVDDVCPPHINFAAYNNVVSKKSYIVYPNAGHGLPGDFNRQKMDWIFREFGLK
ncbi:MAG: acetylxylan esterase [Bacteroidales bacterium]|jgi:cephalosporin-C deacetylase-like acetyl esterase|nr:acetylxylan esterase [Bacteroidales bacterium]